MCTQGHPLIAGSHADGTRTSAAVAALPTAKLHFEIDEQHVIWPPTDQRGIVDRQTMPPIDQSGSARCLSSVDILKPKRSRPLLSNLPLRLSTASPG
jgi:hypothetical protein